MCNRPKWAEVKSDKVRRRLNGSRSHETAWKVPVWCLLSPMLVILLGRCCREKLGGVKLQMCKRHLASRLYLAELFARGERKSTRILWHRLEPRVTNAISPAWSVTMYELNACWSCFLHHLLTSTSSSANSAARLRKKGSWFASKFSGFYVLGYRAMWLEMCQHKKRSCRCPMAFPARNNYRVSREQSTHTHLPKVPK